MKFEDEMWKFMPLKKAALDYRVALCDRGKAITEDFLAWPQFQDAPESVGLVLRCRLVGSGQSSLVASWHTRQFRNGRCFFKPIRKGKSVHGYNVHVLLGHCPPSFHLKVQETESALADIRAKLSALRWIDVKLCVIDNVNARTVQRRREAR